MTLALIGPSILELFMKDVETENHTKDSNLTLI